ncbi:MAG: hypothetical protein A3J75_00030 [Acidobacteria bacterium RBG_16_68_9]|nr:MAG: hypothetical protein A3J75_00030 [Acidobacteria bacterium RBG_16_68_9]
MGKRLRIDTSETGALMRTQSWMALGLGLAPAALAALTAREIYREGNLLSSGLAVLLPVLAQLYLHEGKAKRVVSALTGLAAGCAVTLLWLTLHGELSSFALLTVVLVALIVPIALDLVLLDAGTRVPVSLAAARSATIAFAASVIPFTALLVGVEHREIVRGDQALIREVARHVEIYKNWIVFERIDPKRKAQLKNRVAVRAMGKTYQLSSAHFESVSEERTVRKRTEKRGARRITEVSRERAEQMRVVVDLGEARRLDNIVVFSTRGPLTIAEHEVELPGNESDDEPVS